MNKYEARWQNAKNQALAIKAKCREIGEGYLLHFDSSGFINEDQLQIREDEIVVVDENCTYGIYTNNPEWDQGLHDTIEVTNAMFKREFKIMMEVDW